MITAIPIDPAFDHQEFTTTIEGVQYGFRFDWNDRDEGGGAHYMSIYDRDQQPIAVGVKVVLGVYLGRRYTHPLFDQGAFVAIPTWDKDREAGRGELGNGGRVVLAYFTLDALMGEALGDLRDDTREALA